MSIRNAKIVKVPDGTGAEKPIKGLYRRECGTFTIKSGAMSKVFTDYEYAADFTIGGKRYRTVLCKESDFSGEITSSRVSGWHNPALERACEKLDEYRKNAIAGTGPTRRKEEIHQAGLQRKIEAAADQQRQAVAARKNISVADLAARYSVFISDKKSYSTLKGHLERISADLGAIPLRELDLERLEDWQCTLKTVPRHARTSKHTPTEPLSVVSVNRYVQTFKAMMTKAFDWKLISERRLRELRKIKLADERHNKRRDFLSRDEAERLIDKADQSIKPIIICALQTGCRKGEILGMKWSQVDLTHRIIHLPRTKSGDSRSLSINDRLLSTLKGLIRSVSDDHVFLNPETGKRWADIKRPFQRAVTRAKLDHRKIVFHHLRHTVASWLVMDGTPMMTVATILGHADVQMVATRYAHLSKGHIDSAIASLVGSTPVSSGKTEMK